MDFDNGRVFFCILPVRNPREERRTVLDSFSRALDAVLLSTLFKVLVNLSPTPAP